MTVVIGVGAAGIPAAGGGWRVESARARDRAGLEALFASCSPHTVWLRFFGRLPALPQPYFDDALAGSPALHDAVVGHDGDRGRPAGLASLIACPDPGGGPHPTAELGVLVADAHQRRGLGGAMMGTLLARARARGVTRITASVLPHRAALLAALGRRPGLTLLYGTVTCDARTGVYELH